MPRLSVFSWDGSEDSSRGPEQARRTHLFRSLKNKKGVSGKSERQTLFAQQMMNSLFRPSVMLLDVTPDAPTNQNPLQRCINRQSKRPTMQMHLRIMALSEKRELTQRELITNNLRQNLISSFPYNSNVKDGLVVEQDGTHYQRKTKSGSLPCKRFWLGNLQLSDFRPLQAPFVPDLIRLLVVSIEVYCKANTWSAFFESYKHMRQEAQKHALVLIRCSHDEVQLESLIEKMTIQQKLSSLRVFLDAFPVKPLHLSKAVLKQLIKRPLYDQFLRPHPQIKSLVRQIALPKTRTELDTLSFLMTHIIRAWESAPNMLTGRTIIAEIYGPLLISFTERPIIIDRDVSLTKTVEAALMEIILDVCDAPFWNHLSMLQIGKAFQLKPKRMELGKEPRRSLHTSVVPLPAIENNGDRDNEDTTEDFLTYWPLRSTEAILRDLMRIRLAIEFPGTKLSLLSGELQSVLKAIGRRRLKYVGKPVPGADYNHKLHLGT